MTQILKRSPFGDLLRFYRGQTVDREVGKPLSQEKFALRISEHIGLIISRNTVSNWENGKSDLHPQKDRFLLNAIVAILHRYRGIKTREEANHLLEAGDYRALDEKEIFTINPEWVLTMHVRGFDQDLKNEISTPSTAHRNASVRSPITFNIDAKESMPIVFRTPESEPGNPAPRTLFIGHDADLSKPKGNPTFRIVDKSKITIQILIAINA